ncbi:hypothetical protein [uncultured Cetobacterium sp.]|uniref:hypothetical protein n=1 Tax=uncultured Cetobacterium sp. TaxID=527638 RepID=UPI00260AAA75|nr:hypothetical protein [uncultured Cetobacterium sp.]
MEIYINNKKRDLGIKNGKLTTILEKIQKLLQLESKIITELSINGNVVKEEDIPFLKKVQLIEIKSKTNREVIIESLYYFDRYIQDFFEMLESVEDEIEGFRIYDAVAFVEWSLGLVLSIKDHTNISLIYSDYDSYVEDYKNSAENFLEAFKKEDYENAVGILDMEIVDLIENFEINSKDYLNEIILEESRKNFIN